ncbi:Aldehyde/histidinol dehydrogenase [Aspergillus floccosus]
MASPIPHISNWVNGAHAAPTPQRITVVNPATEAPIATIDATPRETVDRIVADAHAAFQAGAWAYADASTRSTVLTTAAGLLRARIADFVALETQQTGRPVREMRTQLARVPEWLEYFAGVARTHEGRVPPFKGPVVNTLTRQPLGVVAQITPYNHPLLIAVKKLAPALAAGNAVTYRAIAPIAAANMVPVTAELGGKAPVCLFPSLEIDLAVKAALFAAFIASGQTCVTGSRLLVHADMYEAFREALERRVRALRIGDPTDERTQIGAVISHAAVERCAAFVERAVQDGGCVVCGGRATTNAAGRGFFFEPTIVETRADAELACSEVFGPVIALVKCASEEEMVAVANGTSYALGASVWTNDFAQAHRVAARIEAGIVWVNGHHLNDPSSPWGGFKESGVGKENGLEAYESYTKVKSTVFNYGVAPVWFDDEPTNARYG